MAISWIQTIKGVQTLKIFNGISGGKWATVFAASLAAFAEMNRRYCFGVQFETTTDKDAADVSMQTAHGSASVEYQGTTYAAAFNGKALKGKTRLLHPTGKIEKAYIFLPGDPQVNTPQGQRGLGMNAMTVIAVHELIHACGLEDGDHTNEDLFYGNPVPAIGDMPSEDKLMINNRTGNYASFPPFALNPTTVCKIQSLWQK